MLRWRFRLGAPIRDLVPDPCDILRRQIQDKAKHKGGAFKDKAELMKSWVGPGQARHGAYLWRHCVMRGAQKMPLRSAPFL